MRLSVLCHYLYRGRCPYHPVAPMVINALGGHAAGMIRESPTIRTPNIAPHPSPFQGGIKGGVSRQCVSRLFWMATGLSNLQSYYSIELKFKTLNRCCKPVGALLSFGRRRCPHRPEVFRLRLHCRAMDRPITGSFFSHNAHRIAQWRRIVGSEGVYL